MDHSQPPFFPERVIHAASARLRGFFEEIVREGADRLDEGLPEPLIRALAEFSQTALSEKDRAHTHDWMQKQIEQLTTLVEAKIERQNWSVHKRANATDVLVQLHDVISDPWYAGALVRMMDAEQSLRGGSIRATTKPRFSPDDRMKTDKLPLPPRLPSDIEELVADSEQKEAEERHFTGVESPTERPRMPRLPPWQPPAQLRGYPLQEMQKGPIPSRGAIDMNTFRRTRIIPEEEL